jgi:hypothetical protein
MDSLRFNHSLAAAAVFVSIALHPSVVAGQQMVLGGNYDGNNYDLSSHDIGLAYGDTFADGADFTVAGTGDYQMTEVTLPISIYIGNPNPANYLISVVSDVGGEPAADVISSMTPGNIGTSTANLTYDISGVLHGGMTYWLLFQPIAPDDGCFSWYFSTPWQTIGSGHEAYRATSGGVPTGDWFVSTGAGFVQGAFRIEGVEIPEPQSVVLLGLGLTTLAFQHCMRRICRIRRHEA